MAYNLDISTLTAYIDQTSYRDIMIESRFKSNLSQFATVYDTVVTGTIALPRIENNSSFGALTCGVINNSGTASVLQSTLTTADHQQYTEICNSDINRTFLGYGLDKGLSPEKLSEKFLTKWTAAQVQDQNQFVGKSIWGGNSGTSSVYITGASTLIKGVVAYFTYGDGVGKFVTGTASAASTGLTTANAVDIVNDFIAKTPTDIRDKDLVLYMSLANYQTLKTALILGKYMLPAIDAIDARAYKMPYILFPNLMIVADSGLGTRNDFLLTMVGNMVIGSNGSLDGQVELYYDRSKRVLTGYNPFSMGVTFYYPQYCVWSKGA